MYTKGKYRKTSITTPLSEHNGNIKPHPLIERRSREIRNNKETVTPFDAFDRAILKILASEHLGNCDKNVYALTLDANQKELAGISLGLLENRRTTFTKAAASFETIKTTMLNVPVGIFLTDLKSGLG